MLLSAVLTAGLLGANAGARAADMPVLHVQWCVAILTPAQAPLFLGKELGFFKEEGVDFDLNLSPGSTAQCVQLTAAGNADISSPTPTGPIMAINRGADPGVVFVFNTTRHTEFSLVVDPAKVKSYKDLEGKKIGIHAIGSVYIPYFENAMKLSGADPSKVQYVVTGYGAQAIQALNSGEVQGSLYWDYQLTQWQKQGFKVDELPLPDQIRALFGPGFAVSPAFLKGHHKELVAFFRGVVKSIVFADANPEAAVRVFWKMYPQFKSQGMPDDKAMDVDKAVMLTREKLYLPNPKDPDPRWGAWKRSEWDFFSKVFIEPGKTLDADKIYTDSLVADINKGLDLAKVQEFARNYKVSP